MSTATADDHSSLDGQVPFGKASAAQIRAALTPQDIADFDQQWREVMTAATESLDLTPVLRILDAWRRVAWLTSSVGHDGYRRMLVDADERARTGEMPPGNVPWQFVKAQLGL